MDELTPAWTQDVTRVAVLTGAGISVGSGIPDFRGPDGVSTRDPAAGAGFTLDTYLRDLAMQVRFIGQGVAIASATPLMVAIGKLAAGRTGGAVFTHHGGLRRDSRHRQPVPDALRWPRYRGHPARYGRRGS